MNDYSPPLPSTSSDLSYGGEKPPQLHLSVTDFLADEENDILFQVQVGFSRGGVAIDNMTLLKSYEDFEALDVRMRAEVPNLASKVPSRTNGNFETENHSLRQAQMHQEP